MTLINYFFGNHKSYISDNLSLFIAGAAALISLFALFVAIKQVSEMMKQARLSVRPQLEYFTSLSSMGDPFLFAIKNCGFGPAKITSFILKEDKNEYKLIDAIMWDSIFNKYSLNKKFINRLTILCPTFLKPEEEMILLKIVEKAPAQDKSNFKTMLEHISVKVGYSSFYDEPFTLECKKTFI
jgi:hypothetical protein